MTSKWPVSKANWCLDNFLILASLTNEGQSMLNCDSSLSTSVVYYTIMPTTVIHKKNDEHEHLHVILEFWRSDSSQSKGQKWWTVVRSICVPDRNTCQYNLFPNVTHFRPMSDIMDEFFVRVYL